MASGTYAQTTVQRPVEVTRPEASPSSPWEKPRGKRWELYVVGVVVCVIFVAAGALGQHSTPSYLAMGGGQTYSIQVGGDQAGRRPKDQAATIPTPPPQGTPAPELRATPYSVVAGPSVSVALINQVLSTYHSPAVGKGQALYDLGEKSGIDPAFALAFFLHESTMGTRGEATKSRSLGNLRCIPNYRCADNFAQFNTWEDGFKAWYQLIQNLYVAQWKLTTVDQIIPRYAPAADNNNEKSYIASLKHAIDIWHAGQVIVS
jgi:hypothetical protein